MNLIDAARRSPKPGPVDLFQALDAGALEEGRDERRETRGVINVRRLRQRIGDPAPVRLAAFEAEQKNDQRPRLDVRRPRICVEQRGVIELRPQCAYR